MIRPLPLAAAFLLAAPLARAAAPETLPFRTHAGFFSQETHQPRALDPQVFVADPAAPAATGPQGIAHVAGVRPALVDSDPPASPLVTAQDRPLGFTLGQWLGAAGTATVTPAANGRATVDARFTGLRPGGRYSLFENHFDQTPVGFTPLDGAGTANSFTAAPDGTGHLALTMPAMPTAANALLLVYHADGQDHGTARGPVGVAAEHQLIAPAGR